MVWFDLSVLIQFAVLVITLPISAYLLFGLSKTFKLREHEYRTAFNITLIILSLQFLVSWVCSNIMPAIAATAVTYVITASSSLILIQREYSLKLENALPVWFCWFILMLIVVLLASLIVGFIAWAMGLRTLLSY